MGNAQFQNRPKNSLLGSWRLIYDPTDILHPGNLQNEKSEYFTSIPSVFNVSEEGAEYIGAVWYIKEITLPEYCHLFELYIEGWYGKAEFYLDEIKIGERLYGYTPFSLYFEAKLDKLTYTLAVKIDNREQIGQTFKTADFTPWGGIHRNIEIIALPETFIEKAYFNSDFNEKSIQLNESSILADLKCKAFLLSRKNHLNSIKNENFTISIQEKYHDSENSILVPEDNFKIDDSTVDCINIGTGELISLFRYTSTFTLKKECKLWSVNSPNLYYLWLHFTLSEDKIDDKIGYRVGVRKITSNHQGELLLNGKRIYFLGANRHDEHPVFGPAFSPQFIQHDLSIMKQNNFTGFRPAHYPATHFLLDTADQLGLMIMEEIPNYIMMPDMMKNPSVLERGRRMLQEMIDAHYNHPSIMIWSMANECKSHLIESKNMINALAKIAHNMDPLRMVHFTGYPGIANIAEIDADVAGINVYYGDSVSGKRMGPETLSGVLDNLREFMVDEDLNMANHPLFVTEFGSQTVYGYHDVHPYHGKDNLPGLFTIYTEERQAYVIEKFIEQIRSRNFVAGILVWCWRDNRYEPEIAESSAGTIMRYGLFDWTGAPKLAFHILSRLYKDLNDSLK